jgi:DNA invertase Pin-like site-specific DNA recombinase
MSLTVRLDPRTERALDALARRLRQTRSDIVREAIAQYAAGGEPHGREPRPYEQWADVIGIVSIGARDDARTTGERFGELVRMKARARRAR